MKTGCRMWHEVGQVQSMRREYSLRGLRRSIVLILYLRARDELCDGQETGYTPWLHATSLTLRGSPDTQKSKMFTSKLEIKANTRRKKAPSVIEPEKPGTGGIKCFAIRLYPEVLCCKYRLNGLFVMTTGNLEPLISTLLTIKDVICSKGPPYKFSTQLILKTIPAALLLLKTTAILTKNVKRNWKRASV